MPKLITSKVKKYKIELRDGRYFVTRNGSLATSIGYATKVGANRWIRRQKQSVLQRQTNRVQQSDIGHQKEKEANFSLGIKNKTIYAALIGVSLIILQDLISIGSLDPSLHESVMAFSIALPCLVGSFMVSSIRTDKVIAKWKNLILEAIVFIISWVGILGAFLGVSDAFSHISPEAGQTFFGVSVLVDLILGLYLVIKVSK